MKRLKNYLIISTGYPPESSGGICTYTYYKSIFLKNHKVHCTVVYLSTETGKQTINEYLDLIKIRKIKTNYEYIDKIINFIKLNINVFTLIKKNNFDIVEESDFVAGLFFTNLFKRSSDKNHIVKLHTTNKIVNIFERNNKIFSKIFTYLETINLKKFLLFSSTTEFITRQYSLFYNIDLKKFNYMPYTFEFEKQLIKSPKEYDYVLYYGRLQKRKSSDLLIRMIQNNFIDMDNIKFVIIGEDTQGFQNQIKKFNNLTTKNIEFLGYISDREKLYQYIINANLILLPSEFESFGLTQLESIYYNPRTFVLNNSGPFENFKYIGCENNILNKKEFANFKYSQFMELSLKNSEKIKNNINNKFGYNSSEIIDSFNNLINKIGYHI